MTHQADIKNHLPLGYAHGHLPNKIAILILWTVSSLELFTLKQQKGISSWVINIVSQVTESEPFGVT